MRVIIESDYQALSEWATNYVAQRINQFQPSSERPFVLGLPTGYSPLGMYKALIELNREGKVSFRNVVTSRIASGKLPFVYVQQLFQPY